MENKGIKKIILVLLIIAAALVVFFVVRMNYESQYISDTSEVQQEETVSNVSFVSSDISEVATDSADSYSETEEVEEITAVHMEISDGEDMESANIYGIDSNGETIWTVTTSSYEWAQLDRISEIGVYDDRYYYCEDGTIKALLITDGSFLWENSDFGGAATAFIISDDGTIYISGYLGPDFFAVDKEGNTLAKIDSFDEQYYWPYEMYWSDDSHISVKMEASSSGSSNEGYVFDVDITDYSFSMN